MVGLIHRDPGAAAGRDYDLIVIGGGVYGAMLVLESARRGLRALLLERGDFGGATTWNSLRIVHGGLRYLQQLDLARHGESVRERRWALGNFPEFVRPLPCLMPLYGRGLRRPGVFRLALALDQLLGFRRNRGLAEGQKLPAGRVLRPSEVSEIWPSVPRRDLLGGAVWFDAVVEDSHRLLVEVLRWACSLGATCLNYVEAERLVAPRGVVRGVEAVDSTSGRRWEFASPLVVNCAGPWSRSLARAFDRDVPELFRPSLAFNVFLDAPAPAPMALAVQGEGDRGSRTYFLYPWKGGTFAGTYHAAWRGELDDGSLAPEHVEAFLASVRERVPGFDVGPERILRVHWGLLPARREGWDRLAVRDVFVDHSRLGGPRGLYSVSGVKLTTARAVAERTLRRIAGSGLLRPGPLAPGPRPSVRHVPRWADMERLAGEQPEEARRVLEALLCEEAALYLDDLVYRRTDWGFDPRLLPRVTDTLRSLLGRDLAPSPFETWGARRRGAST